MPKVSKEKSLATRIGDALDTLDFNYAHFSLAFSEYGSAIHKNLFELILTLLGKWAGFYENGDIEPGDPMYPVCEMAYRMMCALTDYEGGGRHSARE